MRTPFRLFCISLTLAALAFAPGPSRADDRDLLKDRVGNPYVFLLLDTSGSMNWATQCTAEDMATLYDDDGDDSTCSRVGATPCVPICNYLCESGDCATPRNADDPASKFRQAKEALHQVISEVQGDVSFGFASYNQDDLHIRQKHWLLRVDETQSGGFHTLAGNVTFPAPGSEQVFGPLLPKIISGNPYAADEAPANNNAWGCDRGGTGNSSNVLDSEIGCYPRDAADVADDWEIGKIRRLPKLGADWNTTLTEFVSSGSTTYRVTYRPTAVGPNTTNGRLEVEMDVEVVACEGFTSTQTNCTTNQTPVTRTILYSAPSWDEAGFIYWDNQINRGERERGFVGYTAARASHTCRGWDPSAQPGTGAYLDSDGDIDLSNVDIDPFTLEPYSLKLPTRTQVDGADVFDPTGPLSSDPDVDWRFWRGDVLPYSWLNDNGGEIRSRLVGSGSGSEAFGQASHFRDTPDAGETFLRLDRATAPSVAAPSPLIATGSTPLAGMATFFRHWYSNCGDPGNDCDLAGWQEIAAQHDPDWNCRKKYIIFLTDGAETCDNAPGSADYYRNNSSRFPPDFGTTRDACSYVQAMKQDNREDIESIVIAFGVTQQNPKINCLASDGPPYYVQTKGALVTLLRELFGRFKEESASFASAAVPSVQANVLDKIYLSSFTPLNDRSVWPGRLDAFLKPLPLDPTSGLPDRTIPCIAGNVESRCFAWDAGDSQPAFAGEGGYLPQGLLLQAPTITEIVRGDNSTLRIGTGADQRRVFFGVPDSTAAGRRQYFRYPDPAFPAERNAFLFAWDDSDDPLPAPQDSEIARIIEFTLREKQAIFDPLGTPDDTTDDQHLQYVMGDIFHANPVVVTPPSDFGLYTQDLYWNTPLCGEDVTTTQSRIPPVSYSWFSNQHLCRRQILFSASNDGQLHAFDAGIFRGGGVQPGAPECKIDLPEGFRIRGPEHARLADGDSVNGKFDFGTGRELFSFIPAGMMDHVRDLSEIPVLTTEYGIDNTVRTADVFIDPVRDAATGEPVCANREWRTILLGSYREGGPGIFALDITQPDQISDSTNIPEPLGGSTGYVPSCTDANATGCGRVPFPALLWEFHDTEVGNTTPLDEDANGVADLGEGWSRPGISRIQVCDGACDAPGEPEDRFVAIFGGGLPDSPINSADEGSGNWLYIVDIETGRTLYKRGGVGVIDGAIPADITLVDQNVNGLVDTFYFGTTAGFLYKLDLGEGPFELDADGQITDPSGDAGRYNPFKVFDTGGRPIYLEANAVYVTKLRKSALMFGTGNRWDLWQFNDQTGRFFAAVDTGWADASPRDGLLDRAEGLLTAADYQGIDPDSAFTLEGPNPNYLFGEGPDPDLLAGWWFELEEDEKLITEPFTISGVSFFTVYSPVSIEVDGACARGGESKLFVVNAATAIGYTPTDTGYARFRTASTFTTQPYAESSTTQNTGGTIGNNADTWSDSLRVINRELRKLQPPTCRFANYTIDIKTVRSDTGLEFIAPVPVCIEGHNWKEY